MVLPQIHGFQLELPERWGSWSLTASGHTNRFPLYLPCLLNHESTHFYMSQEGSMESKSITMYLRKGHKKADIFLYLLSFDFILLFQSYPGMYVPALVLMWAHLTELQIHWTNKGKQLMSHPCPQKLGDYPWWRTDLPEAGLYHWTCVLQGASHLPSGTIPML